MPYAITVDREEDYIGVQVFGRLSLEEVNELMAKTSDIRQNHGLDRILSDHRGVTDLPGIADLYKLGKSLAEELFHGAKLAVIGGALQNDEEFAEDVAVNRGVDVRLFHEEQAAREWLGLEDKKLPS